MGCAIACRSTTGRVRSERKVAAISVNNKAIRGSAGKITSRSIAGEYSLTEKGIATTTAIYTYRMRTWSRSMTVAPGRASVFSIGWNKVSGHPDEADIWDVEPRV